MSIATASASATATRWGTSTTPSTRPISRRRGSASSATLIDFILARVEIDFRSELRMGEEVEVRTRCSRVGHEELRPRARDRSRRSRRRGGEERPRLLRLRARRERPGAGRATRAPQRGVVAASSGPRHGRVTHGRARRADGIGAAKNLIVPRNAANQLGPPTTLIKDAHRADLVVHAWTFRNENTFLAADHRQRNPASPFFLADRERSRRVRAVLRHRPRGALQRQHRHCGQPRCDHAPTTPTVSRARSSSFSCGGTASKRRRGSLVGREPLVGSSTNRLHRTAADALRYLSVLSRVQRPGA